MGRKRLRCNASSGDAGEFGDVFDIEVAEDANDCGFGGTDAEHYECGFVIASIEEIECVTFAVFSTFPHSFKVV